MNLLIIVLKRQICVVYIYNFSNIICTKGYWGTMHLHLHVHGNSKDESRIVTKNLSSVNYNDIYRSPLLSKLLKHLLGSVLYMTVLRTRRIQLGEHLTVYGSCYGPIIQTSKNTSMKHMKDDCLNHLHTVLYAYIESLYHISIASVVNILIKKTEWKCLEF